MKYVIDKLSDLEIIKATVLGTLNQDIRKEILSKAVNELNTNGYQRLLIDVTDSKVSPNYTTVNSLDLANYMKTLETEHHAKIAFLSTQTEAGHESFVKLAQAVGGKYIKHFRNYDKAITWLLGGKDIFHS
jgi:hypothetical protein